MTMREGKTARDKQSGAWGARFENRDKRDAWNRAGKGSDVKPFPYDTCNGKKNRRKF